jgi:hypothetical protein
MPSPQPGTNGQNAPGGVKYDPGVAFILEFCTLLATRDEATTEAMGKQVFDTLQGILRDSSQWHAITVSRVAFYALRVLKASYVSATDTGTHRRRTDLISHRTMISPTSPSCCTQSPVYHKIPWANHRILFSLV